MKRREILIWSICSILSVGAAVGIGFEKFNIRTGVRAENWTAMLYGKNITDKETATGAYDIPLAGGSHGQYTSEGSVWGARLTYSF